jgi:3-(3-hydroxy-phenyl)propionate hydroxylase
MSEDPSPALSNQQANQNANHSVNDKSSDTASDKTLGPLEHTEVIIVGAGPSGLALGALLASHQIPFRLFEKLDERSPYSKALGVQAGTLECLAAAFGSELSNEMVKQGLPARYVEFHLNRQAAIEIPLYGIPSQRNFVLILEQNKTEALLESQLNKWGAQVERGIEVIDASSTGEKVQISVKRKDGVVQNVAGSFLVGCDGAHSFVRHDMNLPFEGGSYTGDFLLADVDLKWSYAPNKAHIFMTEAGVVACFPLANRGYRLIILPTNARPIPAVPATLGSTTDAVVEMPENRSVPEADGTQETSLSLEELKSAVATIVGTQIEISETRWRTRFRVHHRIVQNFQRGRIFLVGDAAHIHSPIGGQGMNTGIQDALNLGMKLVQIYRKDAAQNILNGYDLERRPVAKRILRATDYAFRFALKPSTHPLGKLRNWLLPRLLKHKRLRSRIIRSLSQVDVGRQEIARYVDLPKKKAPQRALP